MQSRYTNATIGNQKRFKRYLRDWERNWAILSWVMMISPVENGGGGWIRTTVNRVKAGYLRPLDYTPNEIGRAGRILTGVLRFCRPTHECSATARMKLEPKDWNRTVDILFTRQALSQLSYDRRKSRGTRAWVVVVAGVEPAHRRLMRPVPYRLATPLRIQRLAPPEGFEPSRKRFRRSLGTPGRSGMVGRARFELASLAGSSGLSRGRHPTESPAWDSGCGSATHALRNPASPNCATVRWCETPECAKPGLGPRTGKRQGLSLAGMPDSLQPRISGAFPGIRTRNIWSLKPARLPVAPDQEPQATQDSRRLVLSAAKDCVKRNKCFDWCRSPASNREAPASKAGRYAHSLQIG